MGIKFSAPCSGFTERAPDLEGGCCVKWRSSKCRSQLAAWRLLTGYSSLTACLPQMSSSMFTLFIHGTTAIFITWLCSSLTLQPIWPSWLWNWPASFWTKAGRLSPRSSAPKTTSHCSGSFSSSSRKCRRQSRRRPETSPQRSLLFVRVSRSHRLFVGDKMKIKLHKSWTIFYFLGFVAPDRIDNKFFDPKHAFKEVEVQATTVRELIPAKKPKACELYDGIPD